MPNLERRAQAFEFFIRMGWSPAQSAGIVANLEAESGLRPDAVGDGGLAYGIAQWHPDRQQGFVALIGKPIQGSSFEDQLAWVHAELVGTEKAAGDALRAATTAEEAGAIVSTRYERPKDKEGEARKRAALAAQILASATQIGPDVPTPQPQPERPQTLDLPRARPFNPEQEAAMPDLGTILKAATPLAAAINPAAGLIAGLAGSLIDAFSPKARAALAERRSDPAIAQGINAAVIEAAQAATGEGDPIKATIAARENPAAIASAEAAAVSYLDKLAPVLDKMDTYEAAAASRTIASQDAAAARVDAKDLRPLLAKAIWIAMAVVGVGLLAAIILQVILTTDHKPQADLLVAFTGAMTYLLARLGDVYGYAFGGVQKAGAAETVAEAVRR